MTTTLKEIVRPWIEESCKISLAQFGNKIHEVKADGSFVTKADKDIEKFLREKIENTFPTHRVLGEEFGGENNIHGEQPVWIIDPIDGTEAYLTGLPTFAISIALYEKGKCLYGAVCLPYMNQLLEIENGLVEFNGEPLDAPGDFLPPVMASSNYFEDFDLPLSFKVRCLGSICFHGVYLARGYCQAVLVTSGTLWDIAALFPILESLGFQILSTQGEKIDWRADAEVLQKPFYCVHPSNPAGFHPLRMQY